MIKRKIQTARLMRAEKVKTKLNNWRKQHENLPKVSDGKQK